MAESAPPSLRHADANIFKAATRAGQLEKVKPIVAYWCDYWVLKQILAKGLHNTNPEILEYSTHLMDKMEQVKVTYADEDAITDDTAGQAYVEQFAQETLDRAQRVVRANKVTANTANTFDAAATFFGLVNIWGTPDAETLQKIKYAKWNATRILKAIKDGSDPNASNPKQEDLPPQESVDEMTSPTFSAVSPPKPRPVTIEDEPETGAADNGLRRDSAGVSPPAISPASISPATVPTNLNDATQDPPVDLPTVPSPEPYYQQAAAPSSPGPPTKAVPLPAPTPPTLPSVPSFVDSPPPSVPSVTDYPPSVPSLPPTTQPSIPPQAPPYIPPAQHQQPRAPAATGYPPTYRPAPVPVPAPAPTPVSAPVPAGEVDDLAMANAQKHAKWAISALNFEDVPTAVRELRKALAFLGTS